MYNLKFKGIPIFITENMPQGMDIMMIPSVIRCPKCNTPLSNEKIEKIIFQGNQACGHCLDYITKEYVGSFFGAIKDVTMPQEVGTTHPDKEGQTYVTGARRSARMLRFDLIPFCAEERLAERYTGHEVDGKPDGGALKFGEVNWKKGLPTSDTINHTILHLKKWNEKFQELKFKYGSSVPAMEQIRKEMREFSKLDDHLAGAAWGLFALMFQEDNMMYHDPKYKSGSPADDQMHNLQGESTPPNG